MLQRVLTIVVLLCVFVAPAFAALEPVENFAKATLIQGYGSAVTTMVVTTGQGARFPSTTPFRVTVFECSTYASAVDDLNREILLVTSRTGDSFTVSRGQEGTVASDHNTAGKTYCIEQSLTKAMWESIQTAIDAGAGGPQDITNMIAADLQASLSAANALATNKTLRITDTQIASGDITFAASTTVWIPCGGKITWADGLNINFDRPDQIQAGDCQIFDSKNGVHFTKAGKVNPKWWGISAATAAADNVTAIHAMFDSFPAATVGTMSIDLYELIQHNATLIDPGKNIDIKCHDSGGGFTLTTSATNRDGIRVNGDVSFFSIDGCVIKTLSTVVTDLFMKAVTMDNGNVGYATSPAGSLFRCLRNKISGYNMGCYADGGPDFVLDAQEDFNVVHNGGSGGSAINESLQCLRTPVCLQRNNTLYGDGRGEHGIYNVHPLRLEATGNYLEGYAWEAVKVVTNLADASHPNPQSWNLGYNTLKNNEGSVVINTGHAHILPSVNLDGMVIDGDGAVGSNPAAIMIVAQNTSQILNVSGSGMHIRNAEKCGAYISQNAGALIGVISFQDLTMFDWSLGASGTYSAICADNNGTKRFLRLSGFFDGNSHGRNVLGVENVEYFDDADIMNIRTANVTEPDSAHPTIVVGSSVSRANIAGVHTLRAAFVKTGANTTETDLSDILLKAKSFGAQSSTTYQNGFHLFATGSFAANANTKTLRVKFGSTTVISNDKTPAPNGTTWTVNLWIFFREAGVMVVNGTMQIDCVNQTPWTGSVAEDEDTDLHAKITGQNGTSSDGDIKQQAVVVTHLP
jgi:hypothetical protein